MNDIRVTYSGLIALVVGLASVLTGLAFTLIVTRRLSPEEFGIWSIIGSMISYFLISELVISYWTTRQVSRGEEVGKTAISTSIVFSLSSIPIYLALAFFVSDLNPSYLNLFFLGVVLLPLVLISQTLTAINLGHKPQANSYSLMIFESAKVPAGLFLVYFLDLGIDGAIFATMIALIAKIIIQGNFAKRKLKSKFNFVYVKNWIRLSWIPIYNHLGGSIRNFDVLIYSLITGSVLGVAYYAVSITISHIIAHSNLISLGLYPKLLGRGSQDHVKENLTLFFYFAIPLLAITVIFAEPALFILNPEYQIASTVVIIMAFRTFFYVLSGVLHKVLIGIEKIDEGDKPKFSMLVKSKLFLSPTIKNIHYISYIGILAALVFFMNGEGVDELKLVEYWAMIMLALQLFFFGVILFFIRKEIPSLFPFVSIAKFTAVSIIFSVVFFFTYEEIIVYHTSIFEFLPGVIIQLLICTSVYLIITFMIDKKIRVLTRAILKELMS